TTTLSQVNVVAPASIFDSAILTGAFKAGGTVTYELWNATSTCNGSTHTSFTPVTVTNGIVPNSPSETFTTAGPYSWNATYSGDANNNPATSSCEQLTVHPPGKLFPTLDTILSATTIP